MGHGTRVAMLLNGTCYPLPFHLSSPPPPSLCLPLCPPSPSSPYAQVQFEMIRQFEIQLGEIQQMLHMNVVAQHQLMKENEALKEEIKNLKKIY